MDGKCAKDLELMHSFLDKAKNGIDMNLLAFQTPDQFHYSNSCPAGLGGYSDQGHAWQFKVPNDLKFQATNNLLVFLANQGDCTLSMTDSMTAEGWTKNPTSLSQTTTLSKQRLALAQQGIMPKLFMGADVKGYSQWLAGKSNHIVDALSQDWHHSNNDFTFILCSRFPEQMPEHFEISPIPGKISSQLVADLYAAAAARERTITGASQDNGA